MKYEKHKYNIFPEMQSDDYNRLRDDIRANGYDEKQPIYLYNGAVLDGWNRYTACTQLGIQPTYKEFEGNYIEAINFVMRTNKRRNLNSTQWACIAVEADDIIEVLKEEAKAKQGTRTDLETNIVQLIAQSNPEENKVRTKLATAFNTNRTYVSQAQKLKETAPEKYEQAKRGEKTFTEIAKEEKIQKRVELIEKEKEIISEVKKVANYDFVHNKSILDCAELLPNGIKALITDPPYGQNFISNRRVISEKDKGIQNDNSIDEALKLLDETLSMIYPKMQDNSFAFVFTSWRYEPEFRTVFEKYFTLRNSLIWVKSNHGSGDLEGSFAPKHERILFGVKGNPKLNYRLPDVLNGNQIETQHPTSKPIDLIQELIKVSTSENDIICEPFAGHGSTIISALNLKRNVFATEIDAGNYDAIIKNIYDRFR